MESSSPPATAANAEATANQHKPKIFTMASFTKLWDKKKPHPNFPPSTWEVPENTGNAPGSPISDVIPSSGVHPDASDSGKLHVGTIGKGNTTTALSAEEPVKASLVEDAPDGATASLTLAQRIRELIPSHNNSNKVDTIPPHSTESPPPSPPRPAWIDAGIAQLLESAEYMNGTISQGRKSVWDALERLRAPSESGKNDPVDNNKSPAPEVDDTESDSDADSSVMLYAPLVPDNDSKVELAERETIKTDAHGNLVEVIRDRPAHPIKEAPTPANDGAKVARRRTWWPFGAQKGKDTPQDSDTPEPTRSKSFEENSKRPTEPLIESHGGPVLDSYPTETVVQSLKRRVSQKLQQHSVWVPSATKISFQAAWWGYRIYLPPPVMLVLDDKSLAAAKRAAMITTALQWLIGKIPMMAVPPQLKPGLLIAKRFLPYVGYVGGAIAWSWSTVKSYDKGNGVVMSATWVLPLAVLPSTWDVSKYPKAAPATPAAPPSQ